MQRRLVIFFLSLIFILGTGFPSTQAFQDKDEEISTITLIITPACRLDIVDSRVSKTVSSDAGTGAIFNDGSVELDSSKPMLIIASNDKWKLSVRSTDFTGPYSKDVSDLLLKDLSNIHVENGFSDYQPLSSRDQDIATYAGGVKDEKHPLQYKILLDWEKDVPGTYEATITYTLSTIGS